ncbi:S-layer homology domain-containing protein [uncultured Flavonifractor sp.]|uniref:S-layer homology domain-containing protein n=1 Tax=uncultured Flavonifractor sp. TaxID=1193534 RepID=UPI002634BA6F|nr:S-layer homology domain-containing protein [uncultured Flavonifractor sp.]
MKKLIALMLAAALTAGCAAAVTPEEAFPDKNTYPGYADVAGTAWYADAARVCYEVGLITGTDTGFSPDKILTVGEVAAIAARMNEAITGDAIPMADPKPGETLPWYFSYVTYLERLGMDVPDPEKGATRLELLTLMGGVIPADMLSPINTITALPDTGDETVLRFYNAGILTGVDAWGSFAPDKSLTRAETAALVARVARPELRETFTPADYAPFTAAGLKPTDVLFTGGTTAGAYLPYVQGLIDGLEADCAAAGMEFNWFHTVDGVAFLDYVKDTALAHFGVSKKDGTQLYQNFDVQVYYSRYLDIKGHS